MKNSESHILIFDQSVKGHHLEYINHIYIKALEYPQSTFVFALPESFLEVKHKLKWPVAPNIKFDLFKDDLYENRATLKASFKNSHLLKTCIRRNNPTQVFLVYLMSFMPLLPFFIPRGVRISGIVYMIYLYRWKESKIIKKVEDAVKYLILTKMRVFDKLFILNDNSSTRYLNKKFRTNKFRFLPDPFAPNLNSSLNSIKKELEIDENKIVFLHFGDLSPQKGTLEIFNAIELLNKRELDKFCFLFAGRLNESIKKEFYSKMNILNKRTQIIFFEGYLDFSFIGSLCITCDYMLLPYKRTSQSSGLIGYAALFKKPVIAPQDKLLGKLVRNYNLGITIDNLNALTLANALKNYNLIPNKIDSSNYLKINNVDNFLNIIFKEFLSR